MFHSLKNKKLNKGFTLVEIIVVVVIVGIISAAAIVSIGSAINKQREEKFFNELYASVLKGRSEAMSSPKNTVTSIIYENGGYHTQISITKPVEDAEKLVGRVESPTLDYELVSTIEDYPLAQVPQPELYVYLGGSLHGGNGSWPTRIDLQFDMAGALSGVTLFRNGDNTNPYYFSSLDYYGTELRPEKYSKKIVFTQLKPIIEDNQNPTGDVSATPSDINPGIDPETGQLIPEPNNGGENGGGNNGEDDPYYDPSNPFEHNTEPETEIEPENQYTLTVHYNYEYGAKAAEDKKIKVSENHQIQASDIEIPTINGWTASLESDISNINDDSEINVTYNINQGNAIELELGKEYVMGKTRDSSTETSDSKWIPIQKYENGKYLMFNTTGFCYSWHPGYVASNIAKIQETNSYECKNLANIPSSEHYDPNGNFNYWLKEQGFYLSETEGGILTTSSKTYSDSNEQNGLFLMNAWQARCCLCDFTIDNKQVTLNSNGDAYISLCNMYKTTWAWTGTFNINYRRDDYNYYDWNNNCEYMPLFNLDTTKIHIVGDQILLGGDNSTNEPEPQEHTLTVKYYQNDTLIDEKTETANLDEAITITTPTIEDYEPDKPYCTLAANAESQTMTVTYEAIPTYTITIKRNYKTTSIHGVTVLSGKIADDIVKTVKKGKSITIDVPEETVAGIVYEPEQETVEIPAIYEDKTIEVKYSLKRGDAIELEYNIAYNLGGKTWYVFSHPKEGCYSLISTTSFGNSKWPGYINNNSTAYSGTYLYTDLAQMYKLGKTGGHPAYKNCYDFLVTNKYGLIEASGGWTDDGYDNNINQNGLFLVRRWGQYLSNDGSKTTNNNGYMTQYLKEHLFANYMHVGEPSGTSAYFFINQYNSYWTMGQTADTIYIYPCFNIDTHYVTLDPNTNTLALGGSK